ncbi:hypothetical protein HIM_01079 [Hirsutella minnesotensis 3608]|nr:hypothetical protein HIM_01079 [Hirsutella minnesotensis 3608]
MDAIKVIYSTKETFRKTEWYRHFTTYSVETIFNTSNVDLHRRYRRLLAGPISEASLRPYHDYIQARVELTIDRMRQDMVKRGAADVLKWWLTLIIQKNDYVRHLETIIWLSAIRSSFPLLTSMAKYLPIPLMKEARDSSDRQTHYAQKCIDRYQSLVDADPASAPQTLFTNLFRAEKDDRFSLDEIRNCAEVYMLAGSETTSNTLSFLVWAVCRHPSVQSMLVQQLQTLPKEYAGTDLRDLAYLNQVINEALRLYSSAPSGLPRLVPPGGIVVDGYHLDQGTTVCAQAYTLHRDPNAFPEPSIFDPSRWESPSRAMKDAFMPFGRGPRACLGQHLAMVEMRFAVARFFLEFPDARVSSREGMSDDDMCETNYFVMSPKGKRCLVESDLGLAKR